MLAALRSWLAPKPQPHATLTRTRLGCERMEDRSVPAAGLGWAATAGGVGQDIAYDTATDATGNVYLVGTLRGAVDFDPAVDRPDGSDVLTAPNPNGPAGFAVKRAPDGSFLWARLLGGSAGTVDARELAVGGGGVFLTGSFGGTVDFDPGSGAVPLTCVDATTTDTFLVKLTAEGDLGWVQASGYVGYDRGVGLAADGAGNAYLSYEWGNDSSTRKIALARHNASGSLAWQWGDSHAATVATDAAGNVYTGGQFTGKVDFDPTAGTSYLTTRSANDGFVQKLTPAGELVWLRSFHVTSASGACGVADVTVDAAGGVHTVGSFSGTVDFDPGKGASKLSGGSGFVAKLDAGGGFVRAQQLAAQPTDLAVDTAGSVYVTGWFQGTQDFDPGAGTRLLTSLTASDPFVLRLNADGTFGWAVSLPATGGGKGYGIAVGSSGDLFVCGSYSGTADFDPTAGTDSRTSAGDADFFLWSLSQG